MYPPLQMKYHHYENLRMCLFVCPYVLNDMKGLMIQHPNKVQPELVLLKTKVNNDQNLNYLFAFGEILIISPSFLSLFREIVTDNTVDGTGTIWLSDLNFAGSETSILNCGVTPSVSTCNGLFVNNQSELLFVILCRYKRV